MVKVVIVFFAFFHVVRWVAVLVAASFLLAGCQPPDQAETADKPVTIEYWEKWTGFEADAMREVVDAFNESQDEIHVRYLSMSQIERKLMLAIAGGNPPDVAGLYSHLVPAYAENNALLPLDPLFRDSSIKEENYLPVYWKAGRHRGFTWALPTTPSTLALYWNKKLFREAGLDPEQPPRSLAELEEINEALLRRGSDGRIERLGHTPQEPGWWNPLWVYWFGGDLVSADEALTIDSPEMRSTFRWLASHPERFDGDALQSLRNGFGNFASPQNSFFDGRVAMVLQGPWLFKFIKEYAPSDFEWGVAPFPSIDPAQLSGVTIAECDVLVIPRGSRHPEAAMRFIEYVNSQAAMEQLCLGQEKFSPLREVSPGFYERHPNPDIPVFVELAASPNAKLAPRLIIWQECRNALNIAIDKVMLEGGRPEDFLQPLQNRLGRSHARKDKRWERVSQKRLEEWKALLRKSP